MIEREPRVLIGTLYSGENEFDLCVDSVQRQRYRNYEHVVIKDLPNREAHDALYRMFMERAGEFDIFLKLDADMVLFDSSSLDKLLLPFDKYPNLDHLSFTVHDYFTDRSIWGVNLFSNRVKWDPISEGLFVDEKPKFQGRHLKIVDMPNAAVLHAPSPSPYQAFMFGVHRALKVVQRDRSVPLLGHSFSQWQVLWDVRAHYLKSQDQLLLEALIGAYSILNGKSKVKQLIEKEGFMELYQESRQFQEAAERFWFNNGFALGRYVSSVGSLRSIGAVLRHIAIK